MEKESFIDNYEHASDTVLYTPVNIMGPGADESLFDEQFVGCACSGSSCSLQGCSCNRGALNYIQGTLPLSSPPMLIYECHDHCSCSDDCENRVVQKGPHPDLEVFETVVKGWGLRCRTDLTPGTFVCEYAGEVIDEVEARRRFPERKTGSNYIFCLREHFGEACQVTYVDPTFIGNIGRYINHSCDPNLMIVPVRVDTAVPKICLFARRRIASRTELTFDYGGGSDSAPESLGEDVNRSVCYCAAPTCRGFLPFDSSLS